MSEEDDSLWYFQTEDILGEGLRFHQGHGSAGGLLDTELLPAADLAALLSDLVGKVDFCFVLP